MSQNTPCLILLWGQVAEEFVLQIIEQGVDTLLWLQVLRPVAFLQERHAHTRAPAAGTLDDTGSDAVRLVWRQMAQHRYNLIVGQCQADALGFVEFVIEQQARPVALRPATSADPPGERRAADRQQTIQ